MAGALRVGELLRSPALQLRLLAGAGGLDRAVSWAHVSELVDPTPWLLGAELIMTTGLAVPRSAAAQRAYVERLDDAGVSALALSEGLSVPPLRAAFVAAAEERALPVLEVPLPVPFVTIVQEVAAAVQGDTSARLGAQLRVFGALRGKAAEDLVPAEVFGRLAELSGYSLFACTAAGRPLVAGLDPPPDPLLGLVPTSASAPPTVPGGYVLPVPAPGGTAGWLLAAERDGVRPAGLPVVQHIATVAALALMMERHLAETGRREAAETLAELLRGALRGSAARERLGRHGFTVGAPVSLAAVRSAPSGGGGRVPGDALARALADTGAAHLLLGQGDVDYVLVPASGGLDVLGRVAAGAGALAGVSAPFGAGDGLDVARREALSALGRAGADRPVVAYAAGGADRWLPDDRGALAGLARSVLGPALDHDAARAGRSLVESTRTWQLDRSTPAAAAALHVHPNTLAYRLRRFAALTGRDLGSSADLAELWLAFAALRAVGGGSAG